MLPCPRFSWVAAVSQPTLPRHVVETKSCVIEASHRCRCRCCSCCCMRTCLCVCLCVLAVTPSDSSLSDCSAAAGATVRGAPIPGLTRADDAAVTVKLPFPVRLHGAPYSHATISSNGWVSLGEATGAKEPCNVEGSWPNAACLGAGPVLAPFWGKLVCVRR